MNSLISIQLPYLDDSNATQSETSLVHIHFGAGRLGLGLVAPFFQKPNSRLFLLNRAVSGNKATGSTALSPERRNHLLRDNPEKYYNIQKPGGTEADKYTVRYDGFFEYCDDNIEEIVRAALDSSPRGPRSVVVTASLLSAGNYGPVVRALNVIADTAQEQTDPLGGIFLVACENTLSAHEVLRDEELGLLLSPEARDRVTCVHALVDRMCVELEEDNTGARPVVLARAEDYGSLKLELTPGSEPLVELCEGSRVEFSRYVDTEKQIKSWLLNGSHWLIALDAFQRTGGDKHLKLNQFLSADPGNERFARGVMQEMRDGVAALLRSDPQFAGFVRDIDIEKYLDGAAEAILRRFMATDDPMIRILARFQAPKPDQCNTVESFTKRLADRVDPPMRAYEAENGVAPPAASHSLQSLIRLLAAGKFIDLQAG